MKLSDISYLQVLFTNKEDKEKIVFDTNYPEVQKECDYGIVFGGVSMIPYRTSVALDLYNRDLVNKLILTGGIGFFNKDRKTPESYKMYQFLRTMGVPDSDLIIEDHSRTTLENVKLLLETLRQEPNFEDRTFAVVTSDFHLRRCMETLKKAADYPLEVYGAAAKDGITDLEHWTLSLYGRRMILTEALLLANYAKQGLIFDIELPDLDLVRKR